MQLDTKAPTAFIAALDILPLQVEAAGLAPSSHLTRQRSVNAVIPALTTGSIDVDKPSGYVDGGNLVSFVAGVPVQLQSDVLNSTLLAQLAADKQFDRQTQVLPWYNFYVTVLGKCGWVLQGFNFQTYKSSQTSFTADEVVLELAAAIMAGPGELAAATATLDAMKKLSDGDGRLKLFNNASSKNNQGNFQVGVCASSDNVVAMKNMAFTFNTSDQTTDVLFFHYASSKTQLQQAAQAQTLNNDVYGSIRQAVIDKLGNNASNFIANLDI